MATSAGPPGGGRTMVVSLVIAAIVGAVAGFAGGWMARPSGAAGFWSSAPTGQTWDVYLFTGVQGPPFDENEVGQPPDIFIPDHIVVNRGDTVRIHVYNTENASEVPTEHHTFTIVAPYDTQVGGGAGRVDLDAGTNATITITASTSGVYRFHCEYHLPVMFGWLIVLG